MAHFTRIGVAVSAALALFTANAPAQETWNGSTTDWNTPGNWNPLGVPNSTNIAVTFGNVSVGTVNISSSVAAHSVSFTNTLGNYNLTSSGSQTLTLPVSSSITMSGSDSTIDQVNLASITTGSLLFGVSGSSAPLTFANNTLNGGSLVIGPNTVIGTPGSGPVIFTGPGASTFSGAFAVSGATSVIGGLTKSGPGLLDYSGSGANLGGGLTLNGGLLDIDYFSSTASKVNAGSLTLDGGTLLLTANPGTPVTQTIPSGTIVSAGQTDVRGAGTGTITLSAGNITHSLGGTVDFAPTASAPTFSIQTGTVNTNGLLGAGAAFATVGSGANWATVSGVVVTGLAGYGINIYTTGINTDVTANTSVNGITTNSIRFNTGNLTLTLSGTNTLQSGGILVTPFATGATITGGALTTTGGGELIFHVYDTLTVNSALVSTVGLTKSGSGALVLSGTNTSQTGPLNINRGSLTVTAPAAVNSASQINFNDDRTPSTGFGGLQQFTVDLGNGVNGTITPPIRLSSFSAVDYGTYFLTGNSTSSTITLSGVISSAVGLITPIRFANLFSNSSQFNLTNTNTFTGNISLYEGGLGITSDASLGNSANTLILDVTSAQSGGLVFLNSGVTVARPVNINTTTRIVSNGTDINTISSAITGGGALVKDGAGTLTLTNPNNSFAGGALVNNGTLSLGSTGGLAIGANVTVAAGATFSLGSTSNAGTAQLGIVTLNGGTLRVPSGNASANIVNQIVTSSAGGTVDYSGSTGNGLLLINGILPPSIAINGNSTWLSPLNGTAIVGGALGSPVPIAIPGGVTLTNGIALGANSVFEVTGGGTLFQNSDATNLLGMAATVIVGPGSRFRVLDASSNGGVGNIGTGGFELDGGTFAYGAPTASTNHAIVLTTNGGTIEIELAATAFTAFGAILPLSPPSLGPLTKIGAGTLILGNAGNSFSSLTVNAGAVQTNTDLTLGNGPITVNAGGTLNFTGTTATARTINLNFGTLNVAGGDTLTLNGAAVNGGFMRGAGTYAVTGGTSLNGVTTFTSTTISETGVGSYTNFTSGGTLNIAAGIAGAISMNGFTNQGSGAITLGAGSQISATDFQSYGVMTLNPGPSSSAITKLSNAGTSPMYFNGGSRTFIGTPATAGTNVAGVDLHGQNLVIAGGLFVNNGFVGDSTASPGSVIVDFGALFKGSGTNFVNIITQNGGRVQAGNSPGLLSNGSLTIGPGGMQSLLWQINDARAPAKAGEGTNVSGWSVLAAEKILNPTTGQTTTGNLTWTATSTPGSQFSFAMETLFNPTLIGTDNPGKMDDFFNPAEGGPAPPYGNYGPHDGDFAYTWPVITFAGTYTGPTDSATLTADTIIDASQFQNAHPGTFSMQFRGTVNGPGEIDLVYTPTVVPEPGTLLLTAAAGFGLWRRLRRRSIR